MIHPFSHQPSIEDPRSARAVQAPPRITYTLEASTDLPWIDSSKSVKDALLSTSSLRLYNTTIRVLRPWLRFGFIIGLVLACAGSFFDRRTGNVVFVVSSALIIMPTLVAFMALRIDMVVLLARTYEFWYFSLVSLSSMMMLGMNYGDQRAALFIGEVFLYEFALLMDANSRGVRGTITASATGAVALLLFIALQELDLVKDYGNVSVISYGAWRLKSSDVVANGLSNLAMVLLRNAYRKHLALKTIHDRQGTIRCISYRARLRLVSSASVVSMKESDELPCLPTARDVNASTSSQLRLVPLDFLIDANDLIQRKVALPHGSSRFMQHLWMGVGIIGIAATVMSVAADVGGHLTLAILSFGCSAAFTIRCLLFHNRRLLGHIIWSFDFLFLSLQSNIAHVVLCYLQGWDVAKCLVVWASWCWTHWVLTLDLLTPAVRKRLGIPSLSLPLAVLGLLIASYVCVAWAVLFSRHGELDDRVLLSFTIANSTVKVFAIPVLITRMVTAGCWSLRLLWRVWFQSENELILIQGAVEYDDYDMLRRIEAAAKVATGSVLQRSLSLFYVPSLETSGALSR